MSKSNQRVSRMTALAMCELITGSQRHRGHGVRTRYAYFIPLVGIVCKVALQVCYSVLNDTRNRYALAISLHVICASFARNLAGN